MMLGPRRFNNKPHYLQSTLGSITTGCPPHLVVALSSSYSLRSRLPSSPSFSFSLLLLFSPPLVARTSRADGLHYFTANAQGAILNLYNQSTPTRQERIYASGYIFICVHRMMYANVGAIWKVIGNVSFCRAARIWTHRPGGDWIIFVESCRLVLLKFLKLFCAVKHKVIIIECEIICGCDIVTFCRN